MGIVTLVSGGLDSSLMASLIMEEGLIQYPLFIDYGQRAARMEWSACKVVLQRLGVPPAARMDLAGFGQLIPSGLTSQSLDVFEDAFLPGRNLLFAIAGAAFAYSRSATAVAIALLSERSHLFPDQTSRFLRAGSHAIEAALGRSVPLVAPLIQMTKPEAMKLAEERGIEGTYSCHTGSSSPCGQCISCLEVQAARDAKQEGGQTNGR